MGLDSGSRAQRVELDPKTQALDLKLIIQINNNLSPMYKHSHRIYIKWTFFRCAVP